MLIDSLAKFQSIYLGCNVLLVWSWFNLCHHNSLALPVVEIFTVTPSFPYEQMTFSSFSIAFLLTH